MTLFVNLKDVVEFVITVVAVLAIFIFVVVTESSKLKDSKKGDKENDVR